MMEQFTLNYERSFSTVQPRADITTFLPGELPTWMWPGYGIAIVTQPYPYDGLSVTNGANLIAHALFTKHGIGPFTGWMYVEHYTQENMSDRQAMRNRKPDFDVVRFRWEIVSCGPPYKLSARLFNSVHAPEGKYWWSPVPEVYYPPLLSALGEPVPSWVWDRIECDYTPLILIP